MARVSWHFYDPVTAEDYALPVNPNKGGTFSRERKFTITTTAASDGTPLIFEGQADPRKTNIAGTLLTQAEFEAMDSWARRKHQIRMTDDLGRQSWVVFESFKPERVRSALHPWKHTYTADLLEVNVP